MSSKKNSDENFVNIDQTNKNMKNRNSNELTKKEKKLAFKTDEQIKNKVCDIESRQKKINEKFYKGSIITLENLSKYNQFKLNKQKFGIAELEYDESLYTTKLDKNSESYKKNVKYAKKIEKEILKNKKDKNIENKGDDRYSCIVKRDKKKTN